MCSLIRLLNSTLCLSFTIFYRLQLCQAAEIFNQTNKNFTGCKFKQQKHLSSHWCNWFWGTPILTPESLLQIKDKEKHIHIKQCWWSDFRRFVCKNECIHVDMSTNLILRTYNQTEVDMHMLAIKYCICGIK